MNQEQKLISPGHSKQVTAIVFIDSGVEDYQMLAAVAFPAAEAIVLDATEDGVKQITRTLAEHTEIKAVHIVSHGSPGSLDLGKARLSLDTIDYYAPDLQQWQSAFSSLSSADILLYGCNVAAGDGGTEFLERLGRVTGANIAASANLTGSPAGGGDWELEVTVGNIGTAVVFGEAIVPAYKSVFAITRVSVDSAGNQGNDGSFYTSISADGRFVAFTSNASNLVEGDTNGTNDVFVHDRQTGITTRVSVDSLGNQANANSSNGYRSISADGRFVVFDSEASNLVSGDNNETNDVFVHDRQTGITTLVSVDSSGNQGNLGSGGNGNRPSISADGRFVAFDSNASNLVEGDTNQTYDAFIHDRQTGNTTRVVNFSGNQVGVSSEAPSMSADGRFVAFESFDATNQKGDVFVYDSQIGVTTLVSAGLSGGPANGDSSDPSISADGRFVAFNSTADNLGPEYVRGTLNVFVRDLQTNTTTLVSKDSSGNSLNVNSYLPSISGDGRFVGFISNDNFEAISADYYLRDLLTDTITRVSITERGTGRGIYGEPLSLSNDGRFLTFSSAAGDIVSRDSNETYDIFVVENNPEAQAGQPIPFYEPLVGTGESDRLSGTDNKDGIFGLEGNDTIDGGAAGDEIYGNLGADEIQGNAGNDIIYGGKDNDLLSGGDGNDVIKGDRDSDTLNGDSGNDLLQGGKENDTLIGGDDNDELSGDLGDDMLFGGTGADIFVLAPGGNETIMDFEDGLDQIRTYRVLPWDCRIDSGDNNTTLISVTETGEIIGILNGISASAIDLNDFVRPLL